MTYVKVTYGGFYLLRLDLTTLSKKRACLCKTTKEREKFKNNNNNNKRSYFRVWVIGEMGGVEGDC
jgi:hypothetical protein